MEIPESRYVKTDDGVHVGFQVFGDGPDLAFCGPWLSNVDANWQLPDSEYPAYLRALGRRWRVIMFDRRGFGISDRPATAESMSLEKGLEDLRAVMDAAGSERAVVMGIEAGAAVSLLFAASYPKRVRGLVLVAPLVRWWQDSDFPWGVTDADARTWDEAIEGRWGAAEFWRYLFQDTGTDLGRLTLSAWARWSRLTASPAAVAAIEQVEREVDVRSLLPHIQVPTTVIMRSGDRDRAVWGAAPWVAEQIPGAQLVEIPGEDHFFWGHDAEFFDEVERFTDGIGREEAQFDRILATILFTDICNSSAMATALGDREWRGVVERHHATVRAMLGRYRGVEVDTAGDGFFATFDGPARAIHCARAITDAVRPLGVEVRAGVHTGECELIDGKVGGIAVVIGARIGALAGPSEVLVSQTVRDLVAGSGLRFEDRGSRSLKGVPDEWHLYSAAHDKS